MLEREMEAREMERQRKLEEKTNQRRLLELRAELKFACVKSNCDLTRSGGMGWCSRTLPRLINS